MFAYNIECETKNGEFLVPLTAEGNFILCATRRGKSVYKKIEDFTLGEPQIKKSIVAVSKAKKEMIPPIVSIVKAPIIEIIKEEPIKHVEQKKETIVMIKPETREVQKITRKKTAAQDETKVISKDTYEGYI